eukprot:1568717-Prorocentrum_lima.AAC.1
MTSSLVGSEMCIRDSHLFLHASDALLRVGPFIYQALPAASAFVAPFVAVSYTHLTLPTICSV